MRIRKLNENKIEENGWCYEIREYFDDSSWFIVV